MMKTSASGLVLLFMLRSTVCIPVADFYPFGSEISTRLQNGFGTTISPMISLQDGFMFFNQPSIELFVSYAHS